MVFQYTPNKYFAINNTVHNFYFTVNVGFIYIKKNNRIKNSVHDVNN